MSSTTAIRMQRRRASTTMPTPTYMAVWVLCRAMEVLDRLSDMRRAELTTRLGISSDEIARWDDISRRMYVPFHDDGIISQFEGYEMLREFDWPGLPKRDTRDIQRLDLILEAENDSPNRYKLSKQADVVMLFYLLSSEELGELFARLGYPLDHDTIPKNIAYYAARTSHGSTLCRVVYSWVLARSDRPRSMTFFTEALQSDVTDSQHGTTAEGVHLGAMAGTVDQVHARFNRDRGEGRCSTAQSRTGAGNGVRRHAHPLSRAFDRLCISRATPSRSVETISMWRRFRYPWRARPMSS